MSIAYVTGDNKVLLLGGEGGGGPLGGQFTSLGAVIMSDTEFEVSIANVGSAFHAQIDDGETAFVVTLQTDSDLTSSLEVVEIESSIV